MGLGDLAAGVNRRHYDDQRTLWRYSHYITENGLGAKDPIIDGEVVDDPRIDYLSSHINALEKALERGPMCAAIIPGRLSIC
jgi:beta-glucosidase/6-phospho-beta-glucosidase/beta-galactosidase